MKFTNKSTITIETNLDKKLSSFQSADAKHDLELISMAVQENGTEIEERELDDGTVMITITDAVAADGVVKSLAGMDFTAEIVDRKAWLMEKKKRRKEELAQKTT